MSRCCHCHAPLDAVQSAARHCPVCGQALGTLAEPPAGSPLPPDAGARTVSLGPAATVDFSTVDLSAGEFSALDKAAGDAATGDAAGADSTSSGGHAAAERVSPTGTAFDQRFLEQTVDTGVDWQQIEPALGVRNLATPTPPPLPGAIPPGKAPPPPAAPPVGSGSTQHDSRYLDQTIDSAMLESGDVHGLLDLPPEAPADASPPRRSPTGTEIDNRFFDQTVGPEEVEALRQRLAAGGPTAPDLPSSAGPFEQTRFDAGGGTPPPGAVPASSADSATIDSGFLQRDPEGRVQATWEGRIAPQADERTSLKAVAPPSHRDSKLVIKTRTLRNPREIHSRASDYEVLERLGEGGMGVVYAARQASIDREVAVKMLKPDMTKNRDHREKFLSEAVVTGDLDHPNIVPIYDLGANEAGALFYSMKRVIGTPWIKVLRAKSMPENVEILMKVADAIAFAHARGIVHRDIKPENIMLGEFGEVLVMDWGLALSTPLFRKAQSITQSHSMGGTPAYMAPEMASGPIERIGFASDIYLLGAVLYEIIAGKPPHTGASVMKCLIAAARNEIQQTDHSGELLSIAMQAMASAPTDRFATVQEFQNAIREYQSHSESIVLSTRAESDLNDARASGDYQTFSRALFAFQEALALWNDNVRAQAGLAATRLAYAGQALTKGDFDLGLSLLDAANPAHTSLRDQLLAAQRERDARQHRLRNAKRIMAALTAAVVVIITGALYKISDEKERAVLAEKQATADRDKAKQAESHALASERQARLSEQEAKDSAQAAKLAATQAREAEQKARSAEQQAKTAEQQARADRDLAQQAKNAEEYEAYVARIGLIAAKIDENAFDKALELLSECKPEFRHWEWGRLMHLCQQSVRTCDASAPIDAVAWFPDEKRFVTGGWDGQVRFWNTSTGEAERSLPYGGLYVHGVAVSPDGRWVAAAGNDPRGYVKVWDAASGALKMQLAGHTDSVLSVAFSRDSRRLLTSSYDKTARLWEVETGKQLQLYRGHTWWVWSASFSPDEQRIVTASQDSKVIVWKTASGEAGPPFTGHVGPVYSAVFSPDGRTVASGGYDKRVLVWEPEQVKPFDFEKVFSNEPNPPLSFRAFEGHAAPVRSVRFARDGRLLVSGAHDNALRIWDVESGKSLKTMRGHAGWVRSCVPSADGHWVLSGSHDHQAKLWNIEGYEEERILQARLLEGHADAILSAHFAPDGRSIATASRDRTAKTWDTATGRELKSFEEGHEFLASAALFFKDGKQVLTAAADNTVRIWDVTSGTQLVRMDRTGRSAAVALAHHEQRLLTGSDSKRARLWDAASGALLRELPQHRSDVTAVAFSPQDDVLLAADAGGHCVLYSADSGEMIRRLEGHSGRVIAAAFIADGRRLLTASSDKTVANWDVATGKEDTALVLRHPDAVTSMALAPDGRHVVTLCDDGAIRVWEFAQAKIVRTIKPPGQPADTMALSPDGRRLVIVNSRDRVVRQWDLATGRFVPGPRGRDSLLEIKSGLIWAATFSPDGNFLLTVGGNAARVWEAATGLPGISLSPHGAVASANFSPDGSRLVTASWDNSAKVWDAASGRTIAKLEGAHEGYVNCAVFSPQGNLILTASDDHTARLWSAENWQVQGLLAGHADRVRSAVFSTDGRLAVTASADKTARIWNVATREPAQVLAGHAWGVLCAAFSRSGDRVITGSEDNTARIWDAASGTMLLSLQGHTAGVNWVALSPDGRRALTASQDNTVKLWDAATGKELLTLRGHSQEATAVEFSADSRAVLTGSRDGTAIVWLGTDWRADAAIPAAAAARQASRTLPLTRP